jgi:hypothetical protein
MTRRGKSVFARFLGVLAAVALLGAPLAAQQSMGKVEGTVADQAGVPIANAQVLIVGTSFGTVTNEKGYYFFNNVPVGTYTVRAQLIGYAPAEVRGVRVLGGQTITTDIKLESSAVQVTGVTVTAAANPLVPRDQVTSKSIVSGDFVNDLPVDDMRAVVALTPGVVESGATAGLSIRGGRPGEANVYIDGAAVRGTNNGAPRIELGTNAVEEASVTTGALGVEFSDAQSGVISFTTKSGGEKLSGSLGATTDSPFGDNMSVGFNRLEGSVGGPVPGIRNLRFFGSTILSGQVSDFRGAGSENVPRFIVSGTDTVVTTPDSNVTVPAYVQYSGECGHFGSTATPASQAILNNYGASCNGRKFPVDWNSFVRLQGKLQYSYGSGSSVSLTGLADGNQFRNTSDLSLGAPTRQTGQHNWNRLGVLNWVHQVTRTAEQALSVNLNLSWAQDRTISGPLDPSSELDTREPSLGLVLSNLDFAGVDRMPFPITEDIIRNVRTNSGLRTPFLGQSELDSGQPYRLNPYAMQGSWPTSGVDVAASSLSETRYQGRVVVDWQANRYHRFTLGGDAKKTDLAFWQSNLLTQIFMDAYLVHPTQYGFFASDRLDLGDVVLELGGRYDYYNANALFPTTPARISSHPDWDGNAATSDQIYQQMLDNPDIFTPSVGHSTVSPRLRVSFPITEQTGFRLSYAHQVQTPDFSTLLTGINNDLTFTNTNDIFGRDLDFGKTIQFEFGVRHAFSRDLILDVAAFNKDKVSDYAARILRFEDPRDPTDTLVVNVLTNRDFGNARGVEVKLDWRVGSYLTTGVAYTFQVSKNTGSDPFAYLNTFARQVSGLTGDRVSPPEAANRTNDDRTHNLVGAVSLSFPDDYKKGTTAGALLRNLGVFMTFRVQSGLAYTRLDNQGAGQTAPQLNFGLGGRAVEGLNASVLPWSKLVDLRLTKGLRFGGTDWTLFADIRNLLNIKNVIGAFAETGDLVNARHRNNVLSAEQANMLSEADEAGVLAADSSIDVGASCASWGLAVNCVAMRRAEARFGDGDGIYTFEEQQRALNTYYDSRFGSWRFLERPRNLRLGLELSF